MPTVSSTPWTRSPLSGTVRQVQQHELADVLQLLNATPAASALVTSRIYELGLSVRRLGPELLGYFEDGQIRGICHVGANVVPLASSPAAVRAFADALHQRPPQCAALVGPADQVLMLWSLLDPSWGPAREIRPRQPLMKVFGDVAVTPSRAVRPVVIDEIDAFMPAAVDMFTEEVGVSPLAADGGAGYRARVGQLIAQGRAYALIEDGQVVFKAEIGSVSPSACLVQGVYVRPDRRGEGIAAGGMAAVVEKARQRHAPDVALYVNEYNTRALAVYDAVGFREIGMFATVMLAA